VVALERAEALVAGPWAARTAIEALRRFSSAPGPPAAGSRDLRLRAGRGFGPAETLRKAANIPCVYLARTGCRRTGRASSSVDGRARARIRLERHVEVARDDVARVAPELDVLAGPNQRAAANDLN
jgi:hypothetical protein